MASDRISSYMIGFDGDAGSLLSALRGIKSEVRSTLADIESSTKKVDLFGKIEDDVARASTALQKAKTDVAALTAAIASAKAAGAPTAELEKGLRSAQDQLRSTQREFNNSANALTKLENQLTRAGVDTKNLAAEQLRLAAAHKVAAAAVAEQSAKQTLGVKTTADVTASIDKLQAAFATLRDSGKLTFGDYNAALAALKTRTAEARTETGSLGAAFGNLKTQLIAFAATFTGIALAIEKSRENAHEFATSLAQVGTVTNVSKEQLDRLGAGVRELARTLGFDLNEGLKALYAILRAGIPADNALEVLRVSADAAKAGITDLGSATALSTTLINAFKIPAADLGKTLDAVFQASKDGGATIQELSGTLGELGPIAKAANVPLTEIIAAIATLRKSGLDTGTAVATLTRVIQTLAAPTADTAKKLHELGIESRGLVGTLQQLAAKKISLDVLRDIVDARTLKGVAALTTNIDGLTTAVLRYGGSAGSIAAVNKALDETPEEKVQRFNAAVHDLSVAFGQFIGDGTKLLPAITALLNSFNNLSQSSKDLAIGFALTVAGSVAVFAALRTLAIPINLLAAALPGIRTGLLGVAASADAAAVAVKGFGVAASGLLGYEVGKWARENFAWVRTVGDFLGTTFASGTNTAVFAIKSLFGALVGNKEALRAASAEYQFNAQIIKTQFAEALTGAGQRLEELNKKLAETKIAAAAAAAVLVDAVAKMRAAIQTDIAVATGRIDALKSGLGQLAASLQAGVQATQQAGQQALANLQAETQQRIALLATRKLTEAQLEKETLAIQLDAAQERLAIIQKSATDAQAAFDKEAAARLATAQKTKEGVAQVEQQIAQGKKAILQSIVDQYRAYVNDLLALEKQHLDRVKAIDAERLAVNENALQKIRDLQRAALAPLDQYQDKLLQIDENISKSRQALLEGDFRGAEDFAKKAIALSDTVAGEVKDDQKVIVSAYDAQQTAIAKITEALDLFNAASAREKQQEVERANAIGEALTTAKRQLEDFTAALDKITAKAAAGIALQITADTKDVDAKLKELDAQLALRTFFLQVDGDLAKLQATVSAFKEDIAKNGIPVNLVAKVDDIRTKLKEIEEEKPSLTLEITDALKALDAVKKAEDDLKAINLDIKTNEAEIQAQLDKMNLTATVKVQFAGGSGDIVLPALGLKSGGPVPTGAPTHYAGGGYVFRKPSWSKVPGAGNQDTVPALLQAGSFVLRKSASQAYGDGVMGLLAGVRRSAGGGGVSAPGSIAQAILAGKKPIGLSANLGGDPDLLATINEAYRVFNPLIDVAKVLPRSTTGQNIGDFLAAVLAKIVQSSTVADAHALLDPIAEIANSLYNELVFAYRSGVPVVFGATVTGPASADQVSALFLQNQAALLNRTYRLSSGFAAGGPAGSDTVPALLTPGEYIVSKPAVDVISRVFGGGFLDRLNQMRIPPGALHNLMSPPPPMLPRHFAEGGRVSYEDDGSMWPSMRAHSGGAGSITVNVYGAPSDFKDQSAIRRLFLPTLREIERRSKDK
jgi:TP901 family phage tail tape measure protein